MRAISLICFYGKRSWICAWSWGGIQQKQIKDTHMQCIACTRFIFAAISWLAYIYFFPWMLTVPHFYQHTLLSCCLLKLCGICYYSCRCCELQTQLLVPTPPPSPEGLILSGILQTFKTNKKHAKRDGPWTSWTILHYPLALCFCFDCLFVFTLFLSLTRASLKPVTLDQLF